MAINTEIGIYFMEALIQFAKNLDRRRNKRNIAIMGCDKIFLYPSIFNFKSIYCLLIYYKDDALNR